MAERRKLGEILVEDGKVGPEQVERALTTQRGPGKKRRLGEILVEQGALDDLAAARGLARQLDLPYVDPLQQPVDPDVARKLPRRIAHSRKAFAYARVQRGFKVAMADPRNPEAVAELEFALGGPVRAEVAAESRVLAAIARHYDGVAEAQRRADPDAAIGSGPPGAPLDADAIERALQKGGTAYIEMFNLLLARAQQRGASDIHVEAQADGYRVRFRVDGLLRDVVQLPTWAMQPLSNRIKVVGRMDVAEHRRPQDGRATVELGGRLVDLRLSVIPSQFGESVVVRLLDGNALDVDLASLGWSPKALAGYLHLVGQSQGILLVVGPTGSGKSTTLYGTINRLRKGHASIVSIEDPIEYTIPGVRQVQVDERKGLTFAEAARSLLRQDPNVMVIGEIRDPESAVAAMDAATTGHLVLSTLHASNALAAMARLRDLDVPGFLGAHALLGVVAQRLVRKLCPACATPGEPTHEEWARLELPPMRMGPGARRAGPGCDACQGEGYAGRVGVYELLRLDEELRGLLARGGEDARVAQLAREHGYAPMIEDALQKVRDGVTTLDEVARVVPPDPLRERPKASAAEPEVEIEPETEEVVKAVRRVDATPVTPAAAARRARPLVLAVDDAQEILSLIRAVLEDEFDVVVARDGVEALDAAARHRPDAILMDVMMPRMSGYEACKRLKADPLTAEIPVLILSARGDSTHVKEGFHAGADDYLPKPFDPEEMELRLRALLRRAGKLSR